MPMKSAANPIKGRIISRQVFTASLADCWNKLITLLIVSTGSKKLFKDVLRDFPDVAELFVASTSAA